MGKRVLGVVLLVIGLFLGYFSVYSPVVSAQRGDEKVSISLKGAMLCPFAVVMGLIYLALGDGATAIFGTREHPKALAYILGILLLGVGVLLYFWVKSQLEQAGYHFK